MGFAQESLPDKPAKHIIPICFGKLRADICIYENGDIKRYLTIKNQNLRLALSMAYRTLWMDTFVKHEDRKVMAHTTTLQLREFAKFSQAPDVKAAWPVSKRNRAPAITKAPVLQLEQVDAKSIQLNAKKDKSKPELLDVDEPPIPYGLVGNPVVITGVVTSMGIYPRTKKFAILMIPDGDLKEQRFEGGNLEQLLIRKNVVVKDRITLRSEIDLELSDFQREQKDENSNIHITYEIEKEIETCIAHTP